MKRIKGIAASNEWEPFEHQVAGHFYGEEKLGMLVSKEGVVLKPVQAYPKGEQEVKFYETVFNSLNPSEDISNLKRFLPHYYGITELPDKHQAKGIDRYLCLENLVKNFRFPCILDVKIGKSSWDQYASKEKISREIAKCPIQQETGFRILGIKVYDLQNMTYNFYDRHYCRKLSNEDELHKTLMNYVSCTRDEQEKKSTLSKIITNLEEIQQWFLKQCSFSFRSSSVLIIYEGDTSMNQDCNKSSANRAENLEKCLQVDVKMIDFCHVFESTEYDSNYVEGISSLISHLKRCL